MTAGARPETSLLALVCAAAVLASAGCGQKGPLVLPDGSPPGAGQPGPAAAGGAGGTGGTGAAGGAGVAGGEASDDETADEGARDTAAGGGDDGG